MSYSINKNQSRGVSLLELTIIFVIGVPVLSALSAWVFQSVRAYVQVQLTETEINQQLQFVNLIKLVTRDLDSHRYRINPRVHKSGRITYFNGEINPISNSTRVTSPSIKSDAVTGLRVDMHQVLRKQAFAGNNITLCSRWANRLSELELANGFVAVTADGIFEYSVTNLAYLQGRQCVTATVSMVQSMSLPYLPHIRNITETVRYLIPIIDHYTFYVDTNDTLRYLSHAGPRNIENQPIMSDYGELFFRIEESYGETLVGVFGRLSRNGRELSEYSRVNLLGREPYWASLLN
jgi:hypothetical protein